MDIKKKLKKLREKNGLTQQEVADRLNIGQVSYARYENGTRMPNTEMLARLAQLYNVTSDYLLGLTVYPSGNSNMERSEAHSNDQKPVANSYERALNDKEYDYYQKMKASDKPAVKALAAAVGKLLQEAERLSNIDDVEKDE